MARRPMMAAGQRQGRGTIGFAFAGTGIHVPALHRPAPDAVSRPRAGAAETSSAMAASAARHALDAAGWQASDIDLLIGACSVMEQPIPGTAILVQRRLGLGASGIPAFDVNATCLSALVALDIALMSIETDRHRRVLIVSADLPSLAIDPADDTLAAMFGDGAAAWALAADGPHERLATRFESYGDHADLCRLEAGGTRLRPEDDAFLAATRFHMDGAPLMRATARLFPGFLDRLLDAAGVGIDAIDLIVPHQASRPALDHLAYVVGGSSGRIVDIFDDHGNQVASSLPHALHAAIVGGRIRRGGLVLLIGSAAGIGLGGMVIRW